MSPSTPPTTRARRAAGKAAPRPEPTPGGRDLVDLLNDDLRATNMELRPEYELAERAARLGILLEDALAACVARWGLSKAEYAVLRALRGAGPPYELRPTDIKARILLTSGGVSGVLNRLEKAGLAEREPDAADGRSSWVRLTPSGVELAEAAMRAFADVQVDMFRAVPSDLARDLADKLRQVLLAFGDREPPAGALRRKPVRPEAA